MKKKALIVCFTDLKNDARVTRQVNFVKDDYTVTACCFDMYAIDGVELFNVEKTPLTFLRKALLSVVLLLRLYRTAYWWLHDYRRYVKPLKARAFDIIIANDIEALPFAFEVATPQTRIFFDAHEYAPRQFEDRLYWRVFFQRFTVSLCRQYIPRVHAMSTVNEGLATAYEQNFGVRPLVVINAPEYVALEPRRREGYPIKLVHHGIFNISRQPDAMIEMMKLLDTRFTLDLIFLLPGSASPQTREAFERFKERAQAAGKINILPALKNSEIVSALHEHYDVGIILIPPVNFNYENALPNKLFDCIQARLAMIAGPLREIAHIVNQYDIGRVSPDFTAQGMASVLRPLDRDAVERYKSNTQAAAATLNASFNKTQLLDALKKM